MKKISIIDNQFAHGTSLGSGDLKIYPKHFEWDRSGLINSQYVFITEGMFGNPIYDPVPESRRVAFIIEPMSINPQAYDYARAYCNKFAYILSHDKEFNRIVPNAIYYPFGGCWIKPEDRYVYKKTKLISIIASAKRDAPGHKLRHEVIEAFAGKYNIDVFGRGYTPVEDKLIALKEYAYSIVIENEKSPGWFTEKLIDCLVTGTIPIYWGAPDIKDYFNGVKGGFNIEQLDELLSHEQAHPGSMMSYYNSSTEVKKMFELAKKYVCPEDYMFEAYPKLFV